jgi:hypothetical protein
LQERRSFCDEAGLDLGEKLELDWKEIGKKRSGGKRQRLQSGKQNQQCRCPNTIKA